MGSAPVAVATRGKRVSSVPKGSSTTRMKNSSRVKVSYSLKKCHS